MKMNWNVFLKKKKEHILFSKGERIWKIDSVIKKTNILLDLWKDMLLIDDIYFRTNNIKHGLSNIL
jgi:hypothetical protein